LPVLTSCAFRACVAVPVIARNGTDRPCAVRTVRASCTRPRRSRTADGDAQSELAISACLACGQPRLVREMPCGAICASCRKIGGASPLPALPARTGGAGALVAPVFSVDTINTRSGPLGQSDLRGTARLAGARIVRRTIEMFLMSQMPLFPEV
jgi:hypothetical protein